ncbi:MAG: NCS1 family nucleobase:cation symporter-1 [Phycisphaerales bacterium]|nr:NCS1 family nucleobase:cation symporter-1 [Phycisphaerales bacterium]
MALINADLAPTPPDKRTWSVINIAALWIGMAVCIPTYMLAAGMISAGMNWWQSVLTVMLGNLIVLVPMVLVGHAGTKFGIPFPVLARASFGTTGANVPAIARSLVACGWFGIQCWIGGSALYSIIVALGWITEDPAKDVIAMLGITPWQLVCFLAFWGLHVYIVLRGIESIKFFETWAAPFLIASGLAMLIWALVNVDDIGALFEGRSTFPSTADFWKTFFPQLTAMVGFWATLSLNIPDFTRYCRSQRAQATGQLLGLPPTMTLFCFIGIIVTGATVIIFGEAIWDPVTLVSKLGSTPVVVISMLALLVATLSTNIAANVVSPANGFSNIAPNLINYRTGGLITCALGVIMMPWKLLASLGGYIFTWLIGYSALLGPIAGIMLCDYFIMRRTRLDLKGLYDPRGPYAGINWRAIIALILAVLPNLPGFINAATGEQHFAVYFDTIYGYAWFVGLPLGAVLYAVLMLGKARPADPAAGAYDESFAIAESGDAS